MSVAVDRDQAFLASIRRIADEVAAPNADEPPAEKKTDGPNATSDGGKQQGEGEKSSSDAKNGKQADDKNSLRLLRQATGVWLCGGSQGRLYDIYGETQAHAAIKQVVARGGVVGGTSAGAAIMSETMIREGSSHEAVIDRGFGLTKYAVVDQHFYQRGRQERLFGVLAQHPRLLGIGIDEDTAVIVRRNQLRAIGDGRVSVCMIDPDEADAGLEWICRMKDGDVTQIVAAEPEEVEGETPTFLEVQRVSRASKR